MKPYFYAVIIFFILSIAINDSNAQGCVAVKNMPSCAMSWDGAEHEQKGWQLSVNYRYFRSYKHFRGKHEEKHRVEEGTEVINNDNSINLGATYSFNNKWAASVVLPLIFIDRSSLYEHYGNPTAENPTINPRFHTQSSGFGDVRLTGYYNAVANSNFHLTLGLGLKLPTGNYSVKDVFHKLGSKGQDSLVHRVVDQSIQLGDGGFGFAPEFNAMFKISNGFSAYASGLYLFNPRNTNGVKRSQNLTSNIPLSNEFSVPDQFLARLGATYHFNNMQFSLGGRYEGIPSHDLLGNSDGFRRPGYILSVEPSFEVRVAGVHTFGVNFPIALERNRTQNTIDEYRTQQSGNYTIGDAAFADWLLSLSYSYRISK
jgi:hypothetical protein